MNIIMGYDNLSINSCISVKILSDKYLLRECVPILSNEIANTITRENTANFITSDLLIDILSQNEYVGFCL